MKKTDQINLTPELQEGLEQKVKALHEIIQDIGETYPSVAFASSFGAEDIVLHHAIHQSSNKIAIFTLDTGRLPNETYELISKVKQIFNQKIEVFFPDQKKIEAYMNKNGVNAFYESLELRKECCYIRKVEPLIRALKARNAWVTGMRAEQSQTRETLKIKEFDSGHNIDKINPLVDWSDSEVWAYIKLNDLPYNRLHDKFYPSIGCAPCTRAISIGEDIRAGRWWWENPKNKECGLHSKDEK